MCQFHNSLEVAVKIVYHVAKLSNWLGRIILHGIFAIIQFLPVYHPSDEEMNQPKLFARNVQVFMAKYANSV